MASSTSTRVLAVVLLFAVMGAGFMMGMAWGDGQAMASQVAEGEEPEGRERRSLVIDEVGLEPAQREEVDRIVEHYRIQMRALNEEFRDVYRPRRGALMRGTRDSIKSILSAEQVRVYDSLLDARYGAGREGNQDGPEDRSNRDRDDRDGK